MPKLKFLVEKTSVAGIQNSSMDVFVEYKNKEVKYTRMCE